MFYEIILTKKHITCEEWNALLNEIQGFSKWADCFRIIVTMTDNKINYYLNHHITLPPILSNVDGMVFKECARLELKNSFCRGILFVNPLYNFLAIKNKCEIKKNKILENIIIDVLKVGSKIIFKVRACLNDKTYYNIPFINIPNMLSLNFDVVKNYTTKSSIKYLNILKSIPIFKEQNNNALMNIDTFPYKLNKMYLNLESFDFDKHSIIFGSSGTGKSKLISLIIEKAYQNNEIRNNYRFIMIDPHADIEADIGGLGHVIDFKSYEDSIDLFESNGREIVSGTEELVEIFKNELNSTYNSKLERVLRHAIYLLISLNEFNFKNLRKALTDIEYRTDLIRRAKTIVPFSIINFFLGDFNTLKTTSYDTALAPIISFLDEMDLLPAFSSNGSKTLESVIKENFLTIFSLDNSTLGTKGVKTISGLIMQLLFSLIQSKKIDKKIVFVIDEVSVIENSILSRYLSEARKYNLSLILAGQYFSQISENLRNAIFANVMNYYIFKVSRKDAECLVDNLNIKLEGVDKNDAAVSFLTDLNMRTLVARITKDGVLYPPFKAVTEDLISHPRVMVSKKECNISKINGSFTGLETFDITGVDLQTLTKTISTRRKDWKNE